MAILTRRHAWEGVLAVALAVASLTAVHGPSATAAPACALTPQLRDIAITQGVGSYTPLVRGKEALARAYLSLPSCAAKSASIAVTGATLRVTTPSGTTVINPDNLVTSPAPLLAPFVNGPAVDSPADTRFVIPGNVLAPAATTARFTSTMTVRVNYSAKTSSAATPVTGNVNFTTRPGTTTPISSVVEKRSNALRILVVPMGDPTVSYAQQFTSSDQATTAGAMRALARTLPVPDGTGDLAAPSTTAGIRYAVAPTIADVRSFRQSIGGATKFCGTAANFDGVAANLSTFLQAWNANNQAVPADRVIGVVSGSLSFGGDAGCAEGMSKVGQPITWTRLVPGGSTPSQTGATMAMEIAHTFGDVPLNAANADPFSRYHSKNTQADDTAPNRAYNVPTRQFLATDRTVMAVRDTWNDQTTLLEPSDWAFTLCALTPTPLPATCPSATTTIGTAQNVGNEPTFVISGVISEGPPTAADITESYFRNGVPRFSVDNNSQFRLVQQTAAGATLSNVGIAIEFETSDHHDETDPVGPPDTGTVVHAHEAAFTAAVPFNTGADQIKLMDGTEVLYSRNRVPAPEVTSVSAGAAGATERVSIPTGPANDAENQSFDTTYSSDISGDGNLVVFRSRAQLAPNDNNEHDDIYLRDIANETTTLVSVGSGIDGPESSNGPSFDPVISADGSTVAFVSTANNLSPDIPYYDELNHLYLYSVDSDSLWVGDVSSDYDLANDSAIGRPALSSNGSIVAFTSQASNLDSETVEAPHVPRVYIREYGEGTYTELVSQPSEDCYNYSESCTDEGAQPGSVTDSGRYVSFLSDSPHAGEFVTMPAPGTWGAYVRDRYAESTTLATVGNGFSDPCNQEGCSAIPNPINGDVVHPALLSPLSGDDEGKYVVFDSEATNLVPNDTNAATDVFKAQVGSGGVTRLSQVPGTSPIDGAGDLNGRSFLLDVTPDLGCSSESPACGNDVLIASNADNFRPNDTNGIQDVFTYDLDNSPDDGPTLATVNSDGQPAVADPETDNPDSTNGYRPGGISDSGLVSTFVSTANNLDLGDLTHFADAFVRTTGGSAEPGDNESFVITATGANPDNLRIDLLFRCGSTNYPVAVALQPDETAGTSATWSVNVDPALIGNCPPGSGLIAIANDGFSSSSPVESASQPTLTSQAPSPTIYGPAPGNAYSTYLQYSTVTLDGTARDAEDGVLPGSQLAWFVTPPGGSEAGVGSGTSIRLAPPAGGFAAGVYGVRLRATDSDGHTTSTTSSFTVLPDADNDGVPAALDRTGETGAGCSTVSGSGDHDPTNAYFDPDGDGLSSIDEVAFGEQPCVAATGGAVGATTLRIDPNRVPTSSGTPVTGYLTVANAPETQVLATSLKMRLTATTAAGATVTGETTLRSSTTTNTLFTGKFERQPILDFAKRNSLYGRTITVSLVGYVSGLGPFTASTTISVKK